MRRTVHVLIVSGLLVLAYAFLSPSLSPLSNFDPSGDLPNWIDDVYLNFDTLRTDLSDYRWPTEASKKMSSGFASYRVLHFHAGIDLSTNGRTGYKVFASRDGYVSAITISPYGYGRMLQIKHPDGFTTVYAHLKQFNEAIESAAREKQYRNETYGIDLRFDEPRLPVAKGDVIAYTGDTGVGPAHFHFEILDEHMNPVNPLLSPEFSEAIKDTRYPEFQEASFAPIEFSSRVNGRAEPLIRTVRNLGKHRYSIREKIHVTGAIGISVKATDQADATWQRSNVYQYEVTLDSVALYSSTLNRFSSRETEQIAMYYDWPLVRSGEGRFQKLFLEPGNHLPIYSRLPERAGVLMTSDFPPGEHEIIIRARDISGNTSVLTAHLVFDAPPQVHVRRIDQQFILDPATALIKSITIGSKLPGRKNWSSRSYDPSALSSSAKGMILPIDPDSRHVFRILALDENGSVSSPLFFAPSGSGTGDASLTLAKEFVRDYILIKASSGFPFGSQPEISILDGDRTINLDVTASDERTSFASYPLSSLHSMPARIEARGVVNGKTVQASDEFSVFAITPDEGGRIVAGDGEFMLDFPAHGVYQPLFCRVEKNKDGYSVLPNDVLLNLGATVYYRNPDSSNTSPLGLYYSGMEDYDLLSTTREDGMFKGRIRNLLGDFAVRADSLPPIVTNLRVLVSRGRLRITARLHDTISGIASKKVRLTLDDVLLIPEYDPYHQRLNFDETYSLDGGTHVVRVEASDRMGNSASATKTFHLKK